MMRIRDEFLKAGIFGRFYGFRDMIYLSPPLIMTKEEVDKGLDALYPIMAGLKDIKY